MSMLNLFFFIFSVSLLAGFFSGLFGGGSGLIFMPGFYFLLSLDYPNSSHLMQVAIGSGVSASIILGFFATLNQYKYGQISFSTLRWSMFFILLGGLSGVFTMTYTSSNFLKFFFPPIILSMAFWLCFKNKKKIKPWNVSFPIKAFFAFLSGYLTMFSGVSVFFVPFLTQCGLNIKKSIGTSTFVTMATCFFMSIFFVFFGWDAQNLPPYSFGYVNILFLLLSLIPSIIGVVFGVKMTACISAKYLQKIYIFMMISVSVTMIL